MHRHPDVVAALRTCPVRDADAFAVLCERACESTRGDAARSQLLESGIVEVVVAWLCAHRQHAGVQAAGYRLLRTLGPEPFGARSEGRRRTLAQGGMQAVVTGMSSHAANAHVQQAACALLWCLCRTPAIAASATAPALQAVVTALRVHATSARVNEAGCGALRNLCMEPELAATAPERGALDVVVAALRYHTCPSVLEQAAGALVNLAAVESNAELAVEACALEALLSQIAAHADVPAVCLPASIALYNLTWRWPAAQARARAAGAPAVLRQLLAKLPSTHIAAEDAAVLRDAVVRVLGRMEPRDVR